MAKAAERKRKIESTGTIRTYDFTKDQVTDRRSKKTATIKQILQKGEIERMWDL